MDQQRDNSSDLPLVNAIYKNLGFHDETLQIFKLFRTTHHTWQEGYKTSTDMSELDLKKWSSPIVKQRLLIMANAFLDDNGLDFWPSQTSQADSLQYPRDKKQISEALAQLFWRNNNNIYRYHKYARKDGEGDWRERESETSHDSALSTSRVYPVHTNATYNDTGYTPYTSITGRKTLSKRKQQTDHENTDESNRSPPQETMRPSHHLLTISSVMDKYGNDCRNLGIDQRAEENSTPTGEIYASQARNVHPLPAVDEQCKVPYIEIRRSNVRNIQEEQAQLSESRGVAEEDARARQERMLIHEEVPSLKRTTSKSPTRPSRSSNRKRAQTQKFVAREPSSDIFDIDALSDSESDLISSPKPRIIRRRRGRGNKRIGQPPGRNLRGNPGGEQGPRLHGGPGNQASPVVLDLGESVNHIIDEETSLQEVAPALDENRVHQTVTLPAVMVDKPAHESEAQAGHSVVQGKQELLAPKATASKSRAVVGYTIVMAKHPLRLIAQWPEGKLLRRSLESLKDSVAAVVGRTQIESIFFTLRSSDTESGCLVGKDDEAGFERMKVRYTKIMSDATRDNTNKEIMFEIWIDPTFSDERSDEGAQKDDSLDDW